MSDSGRASLAGCVPSGDRSERHCQRKPDVYRKYVSVANNEAGVGVVVVVGVGTAKKGSESKRAGEALAKVLEGRPLPG